MSGVRFIAAATLRRSIRSRSFLVLGIAAPLAIMTALAVTIGDALAGEYRPSLTIVDPTGGAMTNALVAGLAESGLSDVSVIDDADLAREMVIDGTTDAAIVVPSESLTADGTTTPIVVLAHGSQPIGAETAEAIASQLAAEATLSLALATVGDPTYELTSPVVLHVDEDVGSMALTDSTYFAVGMSSFFSIFAAVGFLATYHRERAQSTLARMLVSPVSRAAPIVGTALGVATVAAVSIIVLVAASTVLLGADWGPLPGVALIAAAIVFTATSVAVAVVALTSTQSSATQLGMILATAWAVFGGVFVEIPTSGLLTTAARFSPFTWALDGIGHNAGGAGLGRVGQHASIIAVFGLLALGTAFVRRRNLMRP
jgi:ABC-2 type transport system permease protein